MRRSERRAGICYLSPVPHPFLTAHWANIVLVSYAVPPAALRAYIPAAPGGSGAKLELDLRTDLLRGPEPLAVVTLAALEFRRTRILGIGWPGLRNFAHICLRFYVKHEGRRGVVFVRQVVPSNVLMWGARKFYNEPYVAAPIESEVKQQHRTIGVEYRLVFPQGGMVTGASALGSKAKGVPMHEHLIRVIGSKPVMRPGPDSVENWIKERQWGFGLDRNGVPGVFELIHPTWGIYPVLECDVRLDFASVFGADWGFLSGLKPTSTILAAGSEVAVFPKQATVGVRWSEKGQK